MPDEHYSAEPTRPGLDSALIWRGFLDVPVPIVVLRGADILRVNAAFATLFGYPTPEALIGRPAGDCIVESEREKVWQHFVDRAATGRSDDRIESTGVRIDGSQFPLRFDIRTLEREPEPLEIGCVTDLTEARRAEDALRASEARYRVLFEASPVSLWEEDFSEAKLRLDTLRAEGVTDFGEYFDTHPEQIEALAAGLKVLDVNDVTAVLQGANDKAELLSSLGRLLTDESRGLFRAELIALAEGQTRFQRESPARTLQGDVKDLIVYWAVAPGWQDTFGRVLVSIIDVTDVRTAERELQKYRLHLEDLVEERTNELVNSNEQLLRATRAKDEFLANMSHEFRTPLNSILGFTGVMLQGLAGPLSEEHRRQIEMVQSSGKHMLSLVSDILDLSKIEAKASEVHLKKVSVKLLARGLTERIEPLAAEKGIEVHFVDDEAPETIITDVDKLSQILLNLLSNAIKFTENGSVSLEIVAADDVVRFIVRDTGIGISPEHREAVFQPFLQLESTVAAKTAGTGLGLTIARNLAELLRGELNVASEVGQGTAFVLTLPIA